MNQEQSKRRHWVITGLIVTWSLTLLGGVWAAATDRQALNSQTEAHATQIDDHEQRLRVIEGQLHRIEADVRWIRHHLETNHR